MISDKDRMSRSVCFRSTFVSPFVMSPRWILRFLPPINANHLTWPIKVGVGGWRVCLFMAFEVKLKGK